MAASLYVYTYAHKRAAITELPEQRQSSASFGRWGTVYACILTYTHKEFALVILIK